MIVETSGAKRRRRVVAGEEAVTVVRPIVMIENGRREELLPGRDRFHRDHDVVRAHPEWFTPADPKDVATAMRHRARCGRMADAIRAKLGRGGRTTRMAAPSPTRRRFQLPTGRPAPQFRLP